MTRRAVAVHEVGHFVEGHFAGFEPVSCVIEGKSFNDWAYSGLVNFMGDLVDASQAELHGWGCTTLAGPVAEQRFAKFEAIHRIGELMEARVFISRAALLRGDDRDEAWNGAILEVLEVLNEMRSWVLDLADILERRGELLPSSRAVKAFLKKAQLTRRHGRFVPSDNDMKIADALKAVPDVLKEVR